MNGDLYQAIIHQFRDETGGLDFDQINARMREAMLALEKFRETKEFPPGKKSKLPRFRLVSGRCETTSHHGGTCWVCEVWGVRLHQFPRTTWGEVWLCDKCRREAELDYRPGSEKTEINITFDGIRGRR